MYRFFDRQGATPHRSLRDMLWCQSRRTVNLRPEAFLSAGPAQTDFQEETLFDTEDSGPTSVLRRQSFARARKNSRRVDNFHRLVCVSTPELRPGQKK